MRVEDSCPRSRLSNCISESVWGGCTSTPITEKLPSIGKSREPRLPETPVTTTTGLAIIAFEKPAVVAELTAGPQVRPAACPDAVATCGVEASAPLHPVQSRL